MVSLKFKGAIFDLDGVVTKTAHIHAAAWKTMFDEFLKKWSEKENKPFVPFTHDNDYIPYVDGKPRYDGVKSFLESREIELPYGDKSDGPEKETVCGLGNKKNEIYNEIIKREGAFVFQSTIKLIKEMRKNKTKIGVASSSKNTKLILETSGIEDLFETRVCGIVSEELHLKGKPDPDIFVKAAEFLGLLPHECLMVEDAISGVAAGRNGNFGLVLGVARYGDDEVLKTNGADIVVKDLGEISLADINKWFAKGIEKDSWNLTYYGFDPEGEKLRETLTTVGNGYFGTRGCFEGESASDIHYPGTYIAGVYNKLPTVIHNKEIYNNDFVNCPNWLPVEFKIGDGDFLSPLKMELLSYRQNLNMREGVMERALTCKDSAGKITVVQSHRIASMASPHYGAIRYKITPQNYSGKITVRSGLDGGIINDGVARYRQLNSRHLSFVSRGKTDGGIYLHMETNRSKIQIAMSAKTVFYEDNILKQPGKTISEDRAKISEEFEIDAKKDKTYTIEKIVSIYMSSGQDTADPKEAATKATAMVNSFEDIYKPHKKTWSTLWNKADIRIYSDRFMQKVTRLHIYHLLTTASIHNKHIDAGIPARGLHGEAYRGHVFWDGIYIVPFYSRHLPETARALLMYRHKRLDAARKYAKDSGYQGAMYPWQTADDGGEETQIIHYNPVSGEWDPDLSCLQRHVSIAVFYNVWDYCTITGDNKFLEDYGAEMMLEIARFWASIAYYDKKTGRYHIKDVMGPDEFHEKYPDAEEGGLKDNAYTNIMVVWLLEKTIQIIRELPRKVLDGVSEKIGFKPSEMDKWRDVTNKMNVTISKDGIISQFDGYMALKELDWDHYRKKYGNIRRLDRILKAEKDSPDRYKVTKQADVLMTFYILRPAEVKRILNRLGYPVKDENKLLRDNYEYYVSRTSHGSTLSMVVHAALAKEMGRDDIAWNFSMEAAKSDIFDTQGGTTIEGVHCGVMAGTIILIIKNMAGISFYQKALNINPKLPKFWNKILLRVLYHNHWYNLEITKDEINIKVQRKQGKPLPIKVGGKQYNIPGNKPRLPSRPCNS